ncbi:MAG: LacI family DNA-binding transcriptional regulator [Ignavibacteriaceae bacterium]
MVNILYVRQITITDIAKKLGIAASTVSRALKDHPDISEETKKRVKKIAKDSRYTPNPISYSLRNNRTTNIAVIIPEIAHDSFAKAMSGIEEIAYQAGYTTLVCQSNENYEREVVNSNMLLKQRVAGIIVSISQNTKNSGHFRNLMDYGIPLVFFDRVCDDIYANKVVIDDENSAFNAVNYLMSRGYKNIAYFGGPEQLGICRRRLNGYIAALKKSVIPINDELIRFGGMCEEDGYNSMDSLIKENNIPDAILAVNDPVAIGAFQRIKEQGLNIPNDIGLIGFSNNRITSLVDPPLTTVNQPFYNMGKKAAEILIAMIGKGIENCDIATVTLETELIIRGSTK